MKIYFEKNENCRVIRRNIKRMIKWQYRAVSGEFQVFSFGLCEYFFILFLCLRIT